MVAGAVTGNLSAAFTPSQMAAAHSPKSIRGHVRANMTVEHGIKNNTGNSAHGTGLRRTATCEPAFAPHGGIFTTFSARVQLCAPLEWISE
jgi:hypothetical protein